jgi:hypothetical protein
LISLHPSIDMFISLLKWPFVDAAPMEDSPAPCANIEFDEMSPIANLTRAFTLVLTHPFVSALPRSEAQVGKRSSAWTRA